MTKCNKMFFFCDNLLINRLRAVSAPTPRRLTSDFALTQKKLHTFVAAQRGFDPRGSDMEKKQAELIQIIWTIVKVAVGYLIGYVTNNPEAAKAVSDFLNY